MDSFSSLLYLIVVLDNLGTADFNKYVQFIVIHCSVVTAIKC